MSFHELWPTASAAAIAPYKMALVVRGDLGMKRGKVPAQCAHAAVLAVQRLLHSQAAERPGADRHHGWFLAWNAGSYRKVALRADEAQFDAALAAARAADLPTAVVVDAGLTQVPAGSRTVLAIGPAPDAEVDAVVGHLKLY